jgi:hypothetical protein
MALSTWIHSWKRSLDRRWALNQALRHKAAARRLATRPCLEALEDRWLLSAYVVTTTADSGTGSLRDAITQVNAGVYNEIDFNIGTSGSAQTISPTSALPALTASGVYINGLSQGGSGNTTQLITLNGSSAGSGSDGLELQGSNCTVAGLIIEDFSGDGIAIDTNSNGNTIGGTAAGAGNVISGNSGDGVLIGSTVSGSVASGNQVLGNYIGTNTAGSAALGNSGNGIDVEGSDNIVGGTAAGAGNVISGNGTGVQIGTAGGSLPGGVLVQGNYIGTDVTGAKAVGNGIGIVVLGSGNTTVNTIGGTVAGARNVISGNSGAGLETGRDAIGLPPEPLIR